MGKNANSDRDVKQVIVIRKDLKMRRGKEIVQGSHASSMWLLERIQGGVMMLSQAEAQWVNSGIKKICVHVNSEEELLAILQAAKGVGLMARLVTDAGLTEFKGVPTKTCVAIGPDWADKIDPITGKLETY